MRLAVLADVHGNLPALEAVLCDVQRHSVDGIIVAGDHLTKGPDPAGTLRLLRSLGAWMIRGNTDDRLVAYHAGDAPVSWRVSDQWAALRWLHRHLDADALDFVASLPEQCVVRLDDAHSIRVVHGSPQSASQHLIPDRDPVSLEWFRRAGVLAPARRPVGLDAAFAQINEPVLICGHSHIPWKQEQHLRLALNPGSVGTPANGDVRAQYALLTWHAHSWVVAHRAVSYDLCTVRRAYTASGLLDEGGAAVRAFLLGIETGQAVLGHFVSHVSRLAARAGCEGRDTVPEDVWERAVATFDWETYER